MAELIKEPRQKYAEALSNIKMQADYSTLMRHEDYLLLIDMLDYSIEALMNDSYRSPVFSPDRYLMEVKKHISALQKLL